MARGMWLRRSTSRARPAAKRRKMADEQEASTSSASPPKKRSSPSKSESPQHGPTPKRMRTQADRYQSDVVEAFSKHSKSRTPSSAKKEVYFGKGAYLAVRTEGGFYLCQTLKYVYNHSRTLQIQWLEETKRGIYKMSFLDQVDRDSVLTQVQLKPAGEKGLKKLPDNEISRIDKILNISEKKAQGQLSDADGRGALDQLSEQLASAKGQRRKSTTPAKKAPSKKTTTTRTPVSRQRQTASRTTAKRKTAAQAKKAAAKKKKERSKKEKKDKNAKRGRAKQDPNSKLVPNNKIELVNKDPMFEVKNENSMPHVSKMVQCKRAIRAVLTNDLPLLKQLLADTKGVPSVFVARSVEMTENALEYAIKANNLPLIRALLAEMNSNSKRSSLPALGLSKENTGSYNYISLGHAVRNINVSRGGKEGNDAFLKDGYNYNLGENDVNVAAMLGSNGANLTTVDLVMRERPNVKSNLMNNITNVARHGHRKLAGELVKRANIGGGYGFNKLHEEVLTCDKPEELSSFKPVSVKKRPFTNDRIMPLHFAAINPNPKILEKLLSVVPEINLGDTRGIKIIHYAAACTGSGPLECLLQRGAFADDTDNQGSTPLMVAASFNRLQNIEVLAKKLKSEEKGGVHRKNTFGYTPLHYAASSGHNEAVRALVKHGADLQATLSAGKNKLTPFMMACERGYLQIVKLLADSGAVLDQRDKLKRTPLMLAAMNGHVPVSAFLLRKGCDPNAKDSSGNSPLHYAAGYGWWYVLRLLLSAGAEPNVLNDWKVPPLAIAFMKANVGCAELLLDVPSVNVNFRDADGWTIVMLTVANPSPDMLDQLKYLLDEKHASAGLKDANDWNALHHLAATNVNNEVAPMIPYPPERIEELKKITIEMATILIARGCDLHAKTSDGETALDIAIKTPMYNADLVKFLLEKGIQLTNFTNKDNENLLHLMVKRCLTSDQTELFNIILENMKKEPAKQEDLPNDTDAAPPEAKNKFDLKEQARARDKVGYTPLLRWAQIYVGALKAKSEENLERGRAFLKCLLQEAESDVNSVVTAKDIHEKKSVVHMLCSQAEQPGKVGGTGAQSDFPALEAVLGSKPDLNLRDKDGFTNLHLAITSDQEKLAQRLVRAGADITLKSGKQPTMPLILALKRHMFDAVDVLVSPSTVNTTCDDEKLAPIHHAAMSNHIIHIIQKLLDKGADINAKDAKGRTPLHHACKGYVQTNDPSTDTLELMLDRGANVFTEDSDGRLPLHYLFFNMEDPTCSSQMDPIEAVSMVKTAMKGRQIDHPDKNKQTPIHAAALRGAIISLMDITESISNIDMKDKFGNTPLSMAALGGHVSTAIFLVQKESSISVSVTQQSSPKQVSKEKEEEEKKKEHIWTWRALREQEEEKKEQGDVTESLFRRVVKNGWQGILFLLMDKLERFNVPYITPIKAAIEEHRLQMALSLISKARSQRIDGTAGKQQNLLHILAKTSVDQQSNKVAEKLLSKGLGLGNDQYGCSPLTYSVLAENVELSKLLWDRVKLQGGKQTLTSVDSRGRSLLAAAFWRRSNFNTDLVSWLLEIGASLNVSFPVPLWETEGNGAHQVDPNRLEEWYHGNDHPVGHLTPLIAAIHVGDFEQVQFLLKKGADPNHAAKDSITPLMWAVKKNDMTLAKVLLDHDYKPGKDELLKKSSKQVASLGSFGVQQWNRQGNVVSRVTRVFNGDDEDSNDDDEDMDDDDGEEDEDMESENEDEDEMENGEEDGEKPVNGEVDKDGKAVGKKGKNAQEDKNAQFKKTSSVNLSARDLRGRTIVHHLMRTCEHGTYQNVDLLKLLHRLGASVDTQDNEGKTPLDYALDSGSHIMATELQRLQGKSKTQMTLPTPKKSSWRDGCDWAGEPSVDFREDSRKLLDKLQQEGEKDAQEMPKYPKPKVDEDSQLRETGEVLIDSEQDIPYDILMTKVDVRYGAYGMNNFYKMQVVYAKGKDMYVLLTRWGRIGDSGQYQRTPFNSKEEAVTEFCKIFKAKSGNHWPQVKQFSKLPGKYNLVKTDPYYDKKTVKKVEFDFKSPKPSKLPSGTQELLKTLTSPEMLKHAMQHCGASERFVPFGRLQKDSIEKATKVLQEIEKLLTEAEKPDLPNFKKQAIHDKIADLSSEYYLLIPNDSFTYDAMAPFDSTSAVEDALKELADISDLEFTGNLMLGAQQRVEDMNPLDYIYRNLDCELVPLAEDDFESQLILKQIENTKQNVKPKVQQIYRVRRKGEEDELATCPLENHKLLWHGTKPFNILSILKRGLRVSPLGVPVTGCRFGLGIYHADMYSKSHHYSVSYNSTCKSRFLFVNEVALGKIQLCKDIFSDMEVKKGSDSLHVHGSVEPNPAQDLLLPSGAVLPLGTVKKRKNYWGCDESEFVTHKDAQVCLRYLVQIKAQ